MENPELNPELNIPEGGENTPNSPLPMAVSSQEEIPSGLESFYEQNEATGEWNLRVDGVPADQALRERSEKQKLNEFREKNTSLMKEIESMTAKLQLYGEYGTPQEIRKINEDLYKLREQQLEKKGDYNTMLEEKTKAMQEKHSRELRALQAQLSAEAKQKGELMGRLHTLALDQGITQGVQETMPLAKGANKIAVLLAREVWIVAPKTNELVAKDADGTDMMGSDAKPIRLLCRAFLINSGWVIERQYFYFLLAMDFLAIVCSNVG